MKFLSKKPGIFRKITKVMKNEDFKNLLYSLLEIQDLAVVIGFHVCGGKVLSCKHFSCMEPTQILSQINP